MNDCKLKELKGVAVVKDGSLFIEKKYEFFEFAKSLEDGYYTITINHRTARRGLGHNAYYWGVVIEAFKAGYLETQGEPISAEKAHELLKAKFLPDGFSSKSLTKSQFNNYVGQCVAFIAMYFSIVVEDPIN